MKNWITRLGLCVVGLTAVVACSGDKEAEVSEGAEKGACFPNGTCNSGLTCLSNVCVDESPSGSGGQPIGENPGGSSGGNSSSNSGGSSSNGLDNSTCFACGETDCTTEFSACDAEAGCTDYLECSFLCGTDTTCVNKCDVSVLGVDALQAMSLYSVCLTTSCLDECSDTNSAGSGGAGTSMGTGGGNTGGSTGTGESCSTSGESRGSCVDSSLEICAGGEWQLNDCAGCGIVAPTSECVQIFVKTFQEDGTDEIITIEGDLRDVVETSELVGAEWYLEADQMGVIQFVAASPIDTARVELDGATSGVGFVTLETPDGVSGCQYELASSGRLERYLILNSSTGNIDWAGCWGEFEDLDYTEEPTTATILSIRTTVATTNDVVTLNLSQILL